MMEEKKQRRAKPDSGGDSSGSSVKIYRNDFKDYEGYGNGQWPRGSLGFYTS